jgi:hypothetical protein
MAGAVRHMDRATDGMRCLLLPVSTPLRRHQPAADNSPRHLVGVLQAEVHAQAAGQVGQVLDVILPVPLGDVKALLEGAISVGVVYRGCKETAASSSVRLQSVRNTKES